MLVGQAVHQHPVCCSPAISQAFTPQRVLPQGLHHIHGPGFASFHLTSLLACGHWLTILTHFSCWGGLDVGCWQHQECRQVAGSRRLGAGLIRHRERGRCQQKFPHHVVETRERTNASCCYDNRKIYSSLKFLYFEPKIFLGKIF